MIHSKVFEKRAYIDRKTNIKETNRWNVKSRSKLLCFVLCVIVVVLATPFDSSAFDQVSAVGSGTAGTYTVTLEPNGGTVKTGTLSVTFDEEYGKIPNPTRKNYDFLGWYSLKYGGSKITKDSIVIKNFSHTLYAHWLGKTTKITLNPAGGIVSTPTFEVRYGTKPNLPTPTLINNVFIGWYTSLKGGDMITSKTIFDEKSKTTLYAHWQEKALKIAFISFNGEEVIFKEVICGKEYGELPKPIKEGAKFVGWYTWEEYSDLEAKPITEKTIATEKDVRKLFARWE